MRARPVSTSSPLGRPRLARGLAAQTALRQRQASTGRLQLSAANRPTLYPGVDRALSQMARRGLPIGIVTNNSRARALAHNQRLGVTRFFRHVLGARDVHGRHVNPPKPAPDMLLRMARELGAEPGEMVFVGDAPGDVEAGNRAGMITIALENGAATRAELEAVHPTHILRGFAEVPALLDRLAREGASIRAVAIDMDGTYVDSWREYREAVLVAARDVGVEVSRPQLDQVLARRAFGSRHDDLGGLIPPRQQQAFLAAFDRRYAETVR